jgi:tRNA dimethylallyltransferase
LTVVALVGVTASGKSRPALGLARRRGDIEIVSVDSMCVYRGMDIGTSKPSRAERAEVPHHLLDLVDPDEEFTVTQFQRRPGRLEDIAGRGHHALLVGGTGLYLRAVVDDLRFPGRYPEVKAGPGGRAGRGPGRVPELHARLAVLDPVAAAAWSRPTAPGRAGPRGHLGSGRPFSTFGPGLEAYPPRR